MVHQGNAIFAVDKLQEAAECVQSYLLFYPNDKEMLENKRYYIGLPQVKLAWFKPRKEAEAYRERQRHEGTMMEYIEKNFKFDEEDEPLEPIIMYRVRTL